MPNANVSGYQTYADTQAEAFGIPKDIFRNLINAESGWNPRAVSPDGAEGIAQLMPGTAPNIDRFDPFASIRFAASLLKQYFDKYGDWQLAAAAYNAGPGAVNKYGGVPPYPETQSYLEKIFGSIKGISPATSGGSSAVASTGKVPSMSTMQVIFWAAAAIVAIIVLRGVLT